MRAMARSGEEQVGGSDAGFSLVESLVAIVLAGVVFTGLAGVLLNSIANTMLARQAQQAIDVATRAVETARNVDPAALAVSTTSAAADPSIVGGKYSVPLAGGSSIAEPVVTQPTGFSNPEVVTVDATRFEVRRYVTQPAADPAVSAASYKRLTVVVSWSIKGKTRSRITSTLITPVRRGLPQPRFEWAFNGAVLAAQPAGLTANRGTDLTVSAVLTNRGARDRWDVTTIARDTAGITRNWVFAWFNDNGSGSLACNGVRDPGEDQRMDPDGNGVADTNTVNPDRFVCLVGTYTLPLTESLSPTSVDLTLKATSNAVSTISRSITTRVTLANQSCPSCTYRNYFLHSSPSGVAVASLATAPLTNAAPTELVLPAYSTDVDLLPGRVVRIGRAPDDPDPTGVSRFLLQVPSTCTVRATSAYLQLYARRADGLADGSGALQVRLRYQDSAGVYRDWATATVSRPVWGYAEYASTVVSLPLASAQTLAAGRGIEVSVTAPSGPGLADMRLAYDTTEFASLLQLPVGVGC